MRDHTIFINFRANYLETVVSKDISLASEVERGKSTGCRTPPLFLHEVR